jgi:hypothetical protein
MGSLFFAACGCENATVKEILSPKGGRRAIVYTRYCGAWDDRPFTTQIAIVGGAGTLPWGEANAFVAGTDYSEPLDVAVEWESETSVVIRYRRATRVLKQERRALGTAIRYEEHP